jgi:hypothetical protein
MSNVLDRPSKRNSRVTLQSLRREIAEFRSRIEDLEDLRELNQAIERNGAKPLIPWSKAKKTLGLA